LPAVSRYKYTGTKGDITTEGLEEFLAAYDAGLLKVLPLLHGQLLACACIDKTHLQVYVKSEPDLPEHLAHAVKVVTGNSFHSVVVNNSKDVLVEFYAPWCSYCNKLEPLYLKMAQVSQRITLAHSSRQHAHRSLKSPVPSTL
jgi:thiol-disulfide isomerase/thioredoxin